MGVFLIMILIAALLLFWLFEFILLMKLADKYFPGRYDKCIWGLLFIVLPFVAPFAFALWRWNPMEKKKKLVKQANKLKEQVKEEMKY